MIQAPRGEASTGSDSAEQRQALERGTLRGWPRSALRWLLLQIIRPFISLTVDGLERVPKTGSFLVVCNHLHNADPILLEMALPRPVHLMAKQELFRNPILGWLVRRTGAFPVNRGRADRAALRHAEALLRSGIPVGMFPEGTRSKSRSLQAAYPGAGLIALRSRAVILPAAIYGTEELPFNGDPASRSGAPNRRASRYRVTIRFGAPFALPTEVEGVRHGAAQASAILMAAIADLLPPAYRGVYGDGREPAGERVGIDAR